MSRVGEVTAGPGVWQRLLRRPGAVGGLVVLVLLVLAALAGPFLVGATGGSSLSPSGAHWFGTDAAGRDLFARTMRGMRVSLLVGALGGVLSTVVAAVLGTVAGYRGTRFDRALRPAFDLLRILPGVLLVALFGAGSWPLLTVLLAAFAWVPVARTVRDRIRELRGREFVLAARFAGVPGWRVAHRHVLPHLVPFLVVDAMLTAGGLILAEAGLSSLGLGLRPPAVSLGTLTAAGGPGFIPAALVAVLVLATRLVGTGLRAALATHPETR